MPSITGDWDNSPEGSDADLAANWWHRLNDRQREYVRANKRPVTYVTPRYVAAHLEEWQQFRNSSELRKLA